MFLTIDLSDINPSMSLNAYFDFERRVAKDSAKPGGTAEPRSPYTPWANRSSNSRDTPARSCGADDVCGSALSAKCP